MEDVEAAAGKGGEVELVGEPRRETEHANDGRVRRGPHRDRAPHREADQQHPPSPYRIDRRERVLDARGRAASRT